MPFCVISLCIIAFAMTESNGLLMKIVITFSFFAPFKLVSILLDCIIKCLVFSRLFSNDVFCLAHSGITGSQQLRLACWLLWWSASRLATV